MPHIGRMRASADGVSPCLRSSREQGEAQLKQLLEAGLTTFICLQARSRSPYCCSAVSFAWYESTAPRGTPWLSVLCARERCPTSPLRPLQDELPPQPEMRLGGVNGFLPYHAVATMMFSAMGPPPSEQEITGLRNRYLDKFLPSRRSKPSAGDVASGGGNISAAPGAAGDSSEAAAGQHVSLQFGYCPIVDLSVPSQPQYVLACLIWAHLDARALPQLQFRAPQ